MSQDTDLGTTSALRISAALLMIVAYAQGSAGDRQSRFPPVL